MDEPADKSALGRLLDTVGTKEFPMQRGWNLYKLRTHWITAWAHPPGDGTYRDFLMHGGKYLKERADYAPIHFVLKNVYDAFRRTIMEGTSEFAQGKFTSSILNETTQLPHNHGWIASHNMTTYFLNIGLYLQQNAEHTDLQAQVEKFPEWLKGQQQLLGAFAQFAETETRKAGGLPAFRSLPVLGSEMAHKLSWFVENYSLKGFFTPEPLTRFVNACGSFRHDERSVQGFNYYTYCIMCDFMRILSTTRRPETDPFLQIMEDKDHTVLRDLSITRRIKYPISWNDLDWITMQDKEIDVGRHDASYYVYMLGLASLRWGITKDTTKEEMDLICDKMKRQLDFTLCSKEVGLLEARMERNMTTPNCLFGKTPRDIEFLKAYSSRVAGRETNGETLTRGETELAAQIDAFFVKYPDYKSLNKVEENAILTGASAEPQCEQGFSERFLKEAIETETGEAVNAADVNINHYRQAVMKAREKEKEVSVA